MRRLALISALLFVPDLSAQGSVKFNRDIRPLLSDNCFNCHGPDSSRRKAGLRLDTEEGIFGKRDDGPIVLKGDPGKSPLFAPVSSPDPQEVMPPPKSNKKLTTAQKEMLRRWIEEGCAVRKSLGVCEANAASNAHREKRGLDQEPRGRIRSRQA